MTLIPLDSIVTTGLQIRAAHNQTATEMFAEAMRGGAKFPPVVLFTEDDKAYFLADGHHRCAAARLCKRTEIDADVRRGDKRDALLCAVESNHGHGIYRTNADKNKAVQILLDDPEWRGWSDREIARRAGVNNATVSRARSLLHCNSEPPPVEPVNVFSDPISSVVPPNDRDAVAESPSVPDQPRQYVTRHGTQAVMRTANIGKSAVTPFSGWDTIYAPSFNRVIRDLTALLALHVGDENFGRAAECVATIKAKADELAAEYGQA